MTTTVLDYPTYLTEQTEDRLTAKLSTSTTILSLDPDITTPCLLWTGETNSVGYGRISILGKNYLIHRLVYTLAGNNPHVDVVRHLCGIRLCANLNHLAGGSRSDNYEDAVRHGTAKRPGGITVKADRAHTLWEIAAGMKKCSRCGERWPLSEYWAKTHSADGYQHYCKTCCTETRRADGHAEKTIIR